MKTYIVTRKLILKYAHVFGINPEECKNGSDDEKWVAAREKELPLEIPREAEESDQSNSTLVNFMFNSYARSVLKLNIYKLLSFLKTGRPATSILVVLPRGILKLGSSASTARLSISKISTSTPLYFSKEISKTHHHLELRLIKLPYCLSINWVNASLSSSPSGRFVL